MFRTLIAIATLSLSISAAQADQLSTRIHDAAAKACAAEQVSGGMPASHYDAIYNRCVERLSNAAMDKRLTEARAARHGTLASK